MLSITRIFIHKTKFIILQKLRAKLVTLSHPLVIANNIIPQGDTIKVLRLLLHLGHPWLPHIKATKAKCLQALNILEILSHPTHGCNCKILFPLYTISYAPSSTMAHQFMVSPLSQPSRPNQNSALRTATRAFRTSPAGSLCADTGVAPLHYCRLTLTDKFLTTILQHPNIPAYEFIVDPALTPPP